ncbi:MULTISPECIES: hypothetical protein [unclassified Paenibacillus]|uniref:hypothetical protein n=2 Tax=Paenibacillus TaxID=44249 RepID=UPI0009A5F70F|nr:MULTISPECIES: hypothetical protein [unclassified Paenibacillus]SLK16603.1 hypothetical protein SAMN06272722_110202 [Paenibacillus sp. RU5A]SOC74416.1 hypothetical protein SAMN05880581_110202 [Paenibacillus sp. RU26A]SOC76580.1 hypothetical protein SAMN05880586_110202 [Paenibacillus sp. RU5M]
MKKKTFISLLTIPLVAVTVSGYMYFNQPAVVSAQSDVVSAANKATQGKVEYIKQTSEDGSYTVRYRDRVNLIEITEEYRDNQLHNKLIIEDGGKKITSYGRDFETGKLVGNTWTMPENLAAENEKLLQISLLENAKEELKSQDWKVLETNDVQSLSTAGGNEQKAISEDDLHKEIVTIDLNTGLPTQRVIYEKDKNGKIVANSTKTEEYKSLDSMPVKIQSFGPEESIEIKEIPAPVIEDKVLEGS